MDPLSGESADESSDASYYSDGSQDDHEQEQGLGVNVQERIDTFEELARRNEPLAQRQTEEKAQYEAEQAENVCSISCCKFNKTTHKPICCPNPDCNSAICRECFLGWFGKPCTEFVCPFCNKEITIVALLERNPELPKNFIHMLLKNLSDGAFLREQIRYQNELPQFEAKKRAEDIEAELKERKKDHRLKAHEFNIIGLKIRLKELRHEAIDVVSCPIPKCNGTCFNGNCIQCNIPVCMNCMCQKTGKNDPEHGKKGKCSILEGCGDEPKRINPRVAELLPQIREIEEKIANYQTLTDEYNKIQNELTQELYRLNGGEGSSTGAESKRYGPRCPHEDCNGYVVIQNWKCASCEVRVCAQCHEVREEDHECNPDTVATIKLMEKDTKDCPRCHTLIHKITGCSQMYCTNCKCLWDWHTKQIFDPNTFIHNPHALEERAKLREQGLLLEQPVAEDIHCRDPVNDGQMRRRFKERSAQTPKNLNFKSLVRPDYVIYDTQHQIRDNASYQTVQTQRRNKLMFRYFKNNITDKEWKKELKSIIKKEERNKELIPVFQNHIECLHILSWRYVLGELTTPDYLVHYEALKNLTMQRFSVINRIFGLKGPRFGEYGAFI